MASVRRAGGRWHRVLLLAFAVQASATSAADAQLVRGRVTTAEDAPLEGALVELVDTAGRAVRRTLTRETGLFSIDGVSLGRFRVRVERIGYETTQSDGFEMGGADTVFLPIVASMRAIVLEAVVAESEGRCEVRPADGQGTAVLWQEARKALVATQLAAQERLLRLRAVRYVRELDPRTHRIREEQGREILSFSGSPFESIDIETLIRDGFARREDGEHMLYGPTADVLLSDGFLDTHCFHVAEGDDPSLIGLAFEPVADREQPEIRGVLWLSRPGAELQHIEYEYVNLRVRGPSSWFHGRTEMARLPSGAWAVTAWWIRSPRLIIRMASTAYEPEVEYVREDGGFVVDIETAGGKVPVADTRTRLTGTVYDSLSLQPLADARVYLSNTSHHARTDSAGRFVIDGVAPGTYGIGFTHPRAHDLGLNTVLDSVQVFYSGETVEHALAVPGPLALGVRACGTTTAPGEHVVAGIVRHEIGGPPAAERPVAAEKRPGGLLDLETDENGLFRVCDVADGAMVLLHVLTRRQGVRVYEVGPVHESTQVEITLGSLPGT